MGGSAPRCSPTSKAEVRRGSSELLDATSASDSDSVAENLGPGGIRSTISAIVSEKSGVTGGFSYKHTYPDCPNPGLHIEGFGTLGLPLSTREAAALKDWTGGGKHSVEHVMAQMTVWAIDGSKVQFRNHRWPFFLNKIVTNICEALGVVYDKSKPRSELFKAFITEASSSLPCLDIVANQSAAVLATVIIVLPSEFSGGALSVKYGDRLETYDYSTSSLTDTTVLCWGAGATPELAVITEGHQLALCYNVIHTADCLVPRLSSQDEIVSRLRQTMDEWNAARGKEADLPTKLVFLLNNKYPKDSDLRHDMLTNEDARLVALLHNVGKLHGFTLGLAQLTCIQSVWLVTDTDDDEPEIQDETVTIESLVELDGTFIQAKLKFDLGKEGVPSHLVDQVTSSEPDTVLDDEYDGISVRSYFRTVIVLFPHWARFELIDGPDGFTDACNRLRARNATEPSPKDLKLVEDILARAGPLHCEMIVSCVCSVAIMWNDLSLWLRTVKLCDAEQSLLALGEDNIYSAVARFGFPPPVEHCIAEALERDLSVVNVLEFLDDFEEWSGAQDSPQLSTTVLLWIVDKKVKTYDMLKVSDNREYEALTTLVMKRDVGLDLLERRIFPMLKSNADCSTLLNYVVFLQDEMSTLLPQETIHRMTRELLDLALPQIDILAAPPDSESTSQAQLYAQGCLYLADDQLLSLVLAKAKDMSTLPDAPTSSASTVLFPLVAYVVDSKGNQDIAGLTELCRNAVLLWLRGVETKLAGVTTDDLSSALRTIAIGQQWPMLNTCIVPCLEAKLVHEDPLCVLLNEMHSRRSQIGSMYHTMSLSLLKRWAAAVPEKDLTSVEAVEYPVILEVPEACTFLFERVLKPSMVVTEDYVKKCLSPLLCSICTVLAKNNLSAASPYFATTLRSIMMHWLTTVMGPIPRVDDRKALLSSVERWNCNAKCENCASVREFLLHDPAEKKTWKNLGTSKKHLERMLQQYAAEVALWKAVPSTVKFEKQGLMVKKADSIMAHKRWLREQATGLELLKMISDDDTELRAVLGEDYTTIMAALSERAPVVSPGPVTSGCPTGTPNSTGGPSQAGRTVPAHMQRGHVSSLPARPPSQSLSRGSNTVDVEPPAKRRKL
ncbi:hypothetical protein C8Q74DRAFT_1237196 [Fomes fomentarius]|nr:hypothetical protein C8Q74DRAFT_1237196 [Fomes fomentarius]